MSKEQGTTTQLRTKAKQSQPRVRGRQSSGSRQRPPWAMRRSWQRPSPCQWLRKNRGRNRWKHSLFWKQQTLTFSCQATSMQQPKPMPSQTYRPTTETSFDNDNNESNSYSPEMVSANFANFSNDNRSPSTAAADSNANAFDSVPATQSDARANGPNPALRKGPNPDLLM